MLLLTNFLLLFTVFNLDNAESDPEIRYIFHSVRVLHMFAHGYEWAYIVPEHTSVCESFFTLLFSATLWKLIPHLFTVSPNSLSTPSRMSFFYRSLFPSELHLHKSLWPFLLVCAGFREWISKPLNHKHVCTYSVKLLFSWSFTSMYSHLSHTFTQAHTTFSFTFIGRDSSTEIWRICFSVSSPHSTSYVI